MATEQATIRPITQYRGVTRVARLSGVSQSHLSRVLRGERKAGKGLAKKLAKLGVEVEK